MNQYKVTKHFIETKIKKVNNRNDQVVLFLEFCF